MHRRSLSGAALASALLSVMLSVPGGFAGEDGSCFSKLSQLQWRYRVLAIGTEDGDAVRRVLDAKAAALKERDVLWLVQTADSAFSNAEVCLSQALWSEVFPQPGAGSSVTLWGKDGGVKLRGESLDIAGILSLIDAMPMRRREMAEQ